MGLLKSQRGSSSLVLAVILAAVSLILFFNNMSFLHFSKKETLRLQHKQSVEWGFDNLTQTLENYSVIKKSLQESENAALGCIHTYSCDGTLDYQTFKVVDMDDRVISNGTNYGIDIHGSYCDVNNDQACYYAVHVEYKILCSAPPPASCFDPTLLLRTSVHPKGGTPNLVNTTKLYKEVVLPNLTVNIPPP